MFIIDVYYQLKTSNFTGAKFWTTTVWNPKNEYNWRVPATISNHPFEAVACGLCFFRRGTCLSGLLLGNRQWFKLKFTHGRLQRCLFWFCFWWDKGTPNDTLVKFLPPSAWRWRGHFVGYMHCRRGKSPLDPKLPQSQAAKRRKRQGRNVQHIWILMVM